MNPATNLNLKRKDEAGNKPPSTLDNEAVYEWFLQSTLATAARAQMVHHLAPHLLPLVRPGDQILDLLGAVVRYPSGLRRSG